MSDNIKDYLEQDDNFLITKKPCKLILDLLNYKEDDNLLIEEDKIWVNSLISKIEYEDKIFNIVLDYSCDIYFFESNFSRSEDYIELSYNKNDTIIKAKLDVQNIKEQVKYAQRLLGGKEMFKDTNHLFRKLYKIYGPISDMDLVHMEILLSQVLRCKETPGLSARMCEPFDPVMMDIKQIVFQGNFLSGLMFEQLNKAISDGLIQEKELPPSILERLFTGDLA